ncbi:TetR/AcrR family transcriptional regulator [Sandaracinobacter sp. RS1-74]|uniref:TetR/AcrR family transcriptional regulator n=1 Tax=Sandaracinobacteroides sayramensis TaxID=2913411 RepID=UPI001EDA5FE8|nr:TetR/AcrR family transcriptional regulator [Sandaracinobacteroides sayramensis]MCG2841121.1 TetR/AcrR family transcriptional regulator [Sandaracinobacteroides sayramensis]
MPPAIDSDARRAAVVAAAAELIDEGGLGAVTFRSLAARLKCSTTVISHYFRDKEEILRETYGYSVEAAIGLREKVLGRSDAPLPQALEETLPLGVEQRRIWRVWLCFWTAALFDPNMAEVHKQGLAGTRLRLENWYLAQGWGGAKAKLASERMGEALYGIAMQALFDPGYWTAGRQRQAWRRALENAQSLEAPSGK